MKLKAAITQGAPEAFVTSVDSAAFANRVFRRVLRSQLGIEQMGPAEFYVQNSDRTVAFGDNFWGCEVRLTGISVKPGRNFRAALDELLALYVLEIESNLSCKEKMQLFVVIMLDDIVGHEDGSRSSLLESEPTWVNGKVRERFTTKLL